MKKTISLTFSISLIILAVFFFFEPEITKGVDDSIVVSLNVSSAISITSPADIALTGINGLNGGTSTASATWVVKTSNATGYNISLKASAAPALATGAYSIADYTPTGITTPDYTWNIGTAVSEFGFSIYNTASQSSVFKNNSTACALGSTVTAGKCWFPFTAVDKQVASRSTPTGAEGEFNLMDLQVQINTTNGIQAAADYQATITATAVVN